jgi:hypothetical protein
VVAHDLTRGAAQAQTPDGKDWPSTVRHLVTNQVIDVDGWHGSRAHSSGINSATLRIAAK